jgi:hypothetical protein
MISKDFVLAGKSIFTIELNEEFSKKYQPHYTFKISLKFNDDGSAVGPYFVSALTGPDNWANYSYVGVLDDKTGKVRTTAKSKWKEDTFPMKLLNRVLNRIWYNDTAAIIESGFNVHHEGKCGRCGRLLTVPSSIESGIGPECSKIMRGE